MYNKKLFAALSIVLVLLLSFSTMSVFAAGDKDGIPTEPQNIDELLDPSESTDIRDTMNTNNTNPSDETPSGDTTPTDTIKYGDVNGDGNVDINDATDYQLTLAGKKAVTEAFKLNGDPNVDSKKNIADVTTIQWYIAGTFKKLPVTYDGYYGEIIRP